MNQRTLADRAAAISLRQLRLFVTIGDLRSVRRASEACRLSQPAVTQALAKLEDQIDAVVVDRRASGSYLNALGEIFHARAARFFDQIEQAVTDAGTAVAPCGAARAVVNRLTRSQMRALLGIIEHGTFERAAATLGISASSLQRAARDLESNVGASLFYRTAAGMLVTPTGVTFGRKMKLALGEIELGLGEVDAARGGTKQQIKVGAMPFGGSVLLASVLDKFLSRQPGVDIQIVNDSAPETAKALRDGDVDLVIGLLPDELPVEIVGLPMAQTPYSIVVRRGHPLTRKGAVEHGDLAASDWIIGTKGSSRRACFETLFPGGTAPRAQIATCALTVTHHLLHNSDRLTLMTSFELEHADDRLRALPYGPILPIPSIGIMMRAGWLPTRMHRDFIEIVEAQLATFTSPLRKVG